MAPIVTALGFGLLALAHSILGELQVLRPLFARSWELPGIPRWAAQRLLRFAWHLTSVAWVGLAGLALGASPWSVLAMVAGVSATIIFVLLRGHFAWPLFAMAAAAAGLAGGSLGDVALMSASVVSVAALVAIALLHVWWAAGRSTGMGSVVPTNHEGQPLFHPPTWATLGVALALLTAAGAFTAAALGVVIPGLTIVVILATVVFGMRALGDGRYVGFSKKHRDSSFADLDDRIYTPLSVLFTFGGVAAALLSAG